MTIGLFDSGVGGLSVWREIVQIVPSVDTVYVADQAHVPYGTRQLLEVRDLSEAITRFLLAEGVDIVVVACNTASAAALYHLRELFPDTPFIGMEPAVKPAIAESKSGVVGVLATTATFEGELFASLIDRYAGKVRVVPRACPGLVEVVENGEIDTESTRALVRECLVPLLAAGVDQLVLGCTHYPFLRSAIEDVVGSDVSIIDPSLAVAVQAARVLGEYEKPSAQLSDSTMSGEGYHRFYTTGSVARFTGLLEMLVGLDAYARQDVRAAWWNENCLETRRAD